jgi:hypothetical protein
MQTAQFQLKRIFEQKIMRLKLILTFKNVINFNFLVYTF